MGLRIIFFKGIAGLWVSADRIFTKLLSRDLRVSTFIFFLISQAVVATSCVLFQLVQSTEFVKFYIERSEELKRRISLEPTEEYVRIVHFPYMRHRAAAVAYY